LSVSKAAAYHRWKPVSDEDTNLNRAMERERQQGVATASRPAPAVTLEPLTAGDAERIRQWRNQDLSGLRTPYPLTDHQQRQWYETVVCDRNGPHRYFAVHTEAYRIDRPQLLTGSNLVYETFFAMVGITYISWENGLAELALVTDPARRRQGIGRAAVLAVLREGFDNLGLHQVYGECYHCNPALGFWQRLIDDYGWQHTTLPARKRWRGVWHDSTYFATFAVPGEGT
jgi:RimJ/RimL family protein N-acetyltransferase